MISSSHQKKGQYPPHGLSAALLSLVVVALSLVSVRPDLHEAFHEVHAHHHAAAHAESDSHSHSGSEPHHHEQGCGIELFASGAVVGAAAPLLLPRPIPPFSMVFMDTGCRVARVGAYLEPPGRAPPIFS